MKKIVVAILIILAGVFTFIKINNKGHKLVQIIDSNNEEITNLITETSKIKYTSEDIYEGNFDIKNINTKDLLSISINELDKKGKINYCTLPSTFTLKELNENIDNPYINKKLTKENIKKISKKDIIYLGENEFYTIKLVDDKYEVTTVCGYTDPFNEVIKTNIKTASKDDKELTIDVTIAFGKIHEIKDNDDYSYDYYKDYKYSNYKETLEYDENINQNLYNIYTYTFKLYEDKYYLKSVKLN